MADNAIFGVTIADVAQLDRAFGYEPKGSRFESWHPQKGKTSLCDWSFLVFAFFLKGKAFPSLLPLARHPLPLRTGRAP